MYPYVMNTAPVTSVSTVSRNSFRVKCYPHQERAVPHIAQRIGRANRKSVLLSCYIAWARRY